MPDPLKNQLASTLLKMLARAAVKHELVAKLKVKEVEITTISPLEVQIKVWPAQGGPRYFYVKIRESV